MFDRFRRCFAAPVRRAALRVCVVRLAACFFTVACLSVPARAQQPPRHANRVRSTTRWGLELIEEGRTKSPSFRALVERLEEMNLIVYVEAAQHLPGVAVGATEFAGCNGAFRYLRVSIGVGATRKRLIALLGHELQHAVEIGGAPEVVDQATLRELYQRIGDASVDGYDSAAARDTGDRVFEELWKWRRGGAVAAAPPAAGADSRPRAAPLNLELTPR